MTILPLLNLTVIFLNFVIKMRGIEGELVRRTLTYSLWNQSTETMNTLAWHPVTFGYTSASQKNIQAIKVIN